MESIKTSAKAKCRTAASPGSTGSVHCPAANQIFWKHAAAPTAVICHDILCRRRNPNEIDACKECTEISSCRVRWVRDETHHWSSQFPLSHDPHIRLSQDSRWGATRWLIPTKSCLHRSSKQGLIFGHMPSPLLGEIGKAAMVRRHSSHLPDTVSWTRNAQSRQLTMQLLIYVGLPQSLAMRLRENESTESRTPLVKPCKAIREYQPPWDIGLRPLEWGTAIPSSLFQMSWQFRGITWYNALWQGHL